MSIATSRHVYAIRMPPAAGKCGLDTFTPRKPCPRLDLRRSALSRSDCDRYSHIEEGMPEQIEFFTKARATGADDRLDGGCPLGHGSASSTSASGRGVFALSRPAETEWKKDRQRCKQKWHAAQCEDR